MTGLPPGNLSIPLDHPDDGGLLPFPTEALAVEYVRRRLGPFCATLTPEALIGDGLRPDYLAKLLGLQDLPLALEVKCFTPRNISPFPEAIRQAASYARQLGSAAFVAPLAGKGATKFAWQASRLGTGLLIAGQFGVGGLYFAHERYRDRPVGGLLLAGVQIARLALDNAGMPVVEWRSDARHLLKLKHGHGSKSWRN